MRQLVRLPFQTISVIGDSLDTAYVARSNLYGGMTPKLVGPGEGTGTVVAAAAEAGTGSSGNSGNSGNTNASGGTDQTGGSAKDKTNNGKALGKNK